MKSVVLHIGLPKTATSYLQSRIFPNLADVIYYGSAKEETENTPMDFLVKINNYTINETKHNNAVISKAQSEISNFLNSINQNNLLFSHEVLAGFLGSYTLNIFNKKLSLFNYKTNAKVLKEIFQTPKVVFVTRKQSSWAQSMYSWHIANHVLGVLNDNILEQNTVCTIEQYFGIKNNSFEDGKCFNINNLNWFKMAKDYCEIFGKENVLVLPYEMLKENPNEFLDEFYSFCTFEPYYPKQIDYVNKKSALETIEYSPQLSKYNDAINDLPDGKLKTLIKKNDRGLKSCLLKHKAKFDISKEKFTPEQKTLIMQLHAKSNKQLSELIGIDLGQYGYY